MVDNNSKFWFKGVLVEYVSLSVEYNDNFKDFLHNRYTLYGLHVG